MKIIGIIGVMLMLGASSALACHEMVHVEDNLGNDIVGVDVQLTSDCGWGPATDDTDSNGWTTNWPVTAECWYSATVVTPPQGYTCDYRADSGPDYNTGGQGYIYIKCVPEEVPEFTTIGAALALLGAGLVAYRKRR